jgi:hypothetical protein
MGISKTRNVVAYGILKSDTIAKTRNIVAYAITLPVPKATLRKVSAYALLDVPSSATIRKISAYVLTGIDNRPKWAIAGSVGILAQINKEHGKTFTDEQITFKPPTLATDQTSGNSRVVAVAQLPSGYVGEFEFHYNRFSIEEPFNGTTLEPPEGDFANVHAALDAINAKYGIKLEQRDVANLAIGASKGILLRVVATSFYYLPGTTVSLGSSDPTLAELAPVTDLLGFEVEGSGYPELSEVAGVTDLLGFDPS